jgi:hypothetical protein
VENIKTSCYLPSYRYRFPFARISNPTCGSGRVTRAAESLGAKPSPLGMGRDHFGHVRIEGKIRMFDWEKSSGVEIAHQNFAFFAPRPRTEFGSPAGAENGLI